MTSAQRQRELKKAKRGYIIVGSVGLLLLIVLTILVILNPLVMLLLMAIVLGAIGFISFINALVDVIMWHEDKKGNPWKK